MQSPNRKKLHGILLLLLLGYASAIPDYKFTDQVEATVNTVGPANNFQETYDFYKYPFCAPKTPEVHHEGLSEVLSGDRKKESLYDIRFGVDVQWRALCQKVLSKSDVNQFVEAIRNRYKFELFIDELAVVGPFGEVNDRHDTTSLYSHRLFVISANDKNVIAVNMTLGEPVQLVEGEGKEVEFSYEIRWVKSSVADPNDRIEVHKRVASFDQEVEIHWLSIINSMMLVILLVFVLGVILFRTLKDDFTRYMDVDEEDFLDDGEETGWKLVHGDVFRPPQFPMLFAAAYGSGCQLLVLSLLIVTLALLGTYYPGNRGTIYSTAIVIYALTAGISGYAAQYLYKQLNKAADEYWFMLGVLTSCFFALPTLMVFAVVNTVAISYGTTSALPFGTILLMIFIHAIVTLPLTLLGAARGKRSEPVAFPCKTNLITRSIPPSAWYRHWAAQLAFGGLPPFTAIYIELHYVFSSVWGHALYTVFGILFLCFLLVIIVTAVLAIAMVYSQLAVENHRWWWRCFASAASLGGFMYAYSWYYYNYQSEMSGGLQATFFFGYTFLISYAFALMMGSVGVFFSQRFVMHIYATVKID